MEVVEGKKIGYIYERFSNYSVHDVLMTVTTIECPKGTH